VSRYAYVYRGANGLQLIKVLPSCWRKQDSLRRHSLLPEGTANSFCSIRCRFCASSRKLFSLGHQRPEDQERGRCDGREREKRSLEARVLDD
jgi:hypothetical protein